jgi:hypothetical protein
MMNIDTQNVGIVKSESQKNLNFGFKTLAKKLRPTVIDLTTKF